MLSHVRGFAPVRRRLTRPSVLLSLRFSIFDCRFSIGIDSGRRTVFLATNRCPSAFGLRTSDFGLCLQIRGPAWGSGYMLDFIESGSCSCGTLEAEMAATKLLVTRSDEVMSGAVVFTGTRVPVQTLLDYLEEGDRLDDFLEDFPTVSREHALAVLEFAKQSVLAHADSSG